MPSKDNRYQVITEEGVVFVDNILKPDTPELRKSNPQYAKGGYRVVLGFPKQAPKVQEWLKTHGAKLLQLVKQDLAVDDTTAKKMLFDRIKDGDALIEKIKRDIQVGRKDPNARVPNEYAGHWLLHAKSKSAPVALKVDGSPLTEQDIYRGVFGVADITFFTYDTGAVSGLGCWLNGFVKTRDGKPLGGRAVVTENLLSYVREKVVVPLDEPAAEDEFGF